MLDALDYNYSDRYLVEASKAGIISFEDIPLEYELCTKKKAVSMLARTYQLKNNGKKLDLDKYRDISDKDEPITVGELNNILKNI
jgi:hypothetical protein